MLFMLSSLIGSVLCARDGLEIFCKFKQVQELELGTDMKSVNNLLLFLEKVFNGGSDFK